VNDNKTIDDVIFKIILECWKLVIKYIKIAASCLKSDPLLNGTNSIINMADNSIKEIKSRLSKIFLIN
jgi:hypothetical protein